MGHRFIWMNKQAGVNNIQERLDRGMATKIWIERFPEAEVVHLTRVLSNHCPILIKWATNT